VTAEFQTANVAYFQRKIQLSGFSAHPDGSPSQWVGISGVLLFPKLKTTLKRSRFQTIGEIQENSIIKLHGITESAFQEAFQQWKKRWEGCIASRGDYFEGNDV
jgi:hypothetical protein